VVVLAALGGAAFWAYTAWNEAGAETQRLRWGNITIVMPAPSDTDDLYASQEWYSPGMYSPDFSPDASTPSIPALRLTKGEGLDASWVVIDADTGEIVHQEVQPEDQGAFDAVLATIQMPNTELAPQASAPWPYGAALPATARLSWGKITYVEPDPASGMVVRHGLGDFGARGPVNLLWISSANSSVEINADTGEVGMNLVAEGDREAFDRFMSEMRVLGGEEPDATAAVNATSQPGVPPAAKTDEEWIALIKTAEKIRSGETPAVLPSPSIPEGVTLLTSCALLPSEIRFSAVANEPGPLPNTGRTVFRFTDVSESGDGPEYALVVDWRDNVSMCDSRVKVTVTNAVAEQAAIDAHICDQMRVAADGNKVTDQTLRQPSAAVAKEYLAAFCP
jgi:hypothetical protein